MRNFDAAWRQFLQNLLWYVVLMGLVLLAFRFLPLPIFFRLLLLWGVGLGGIVLLGVQAGRLMSGRERERLQMEARLKEYREQAMAYKKQIDRLLRASGRRNAPGVRAERLQMQVNRWTESVQDLIERVNLLRQDAVIARDMRRVPAAIAELETRLAAETDESVRAQLTQTLSNRRQQLESLRELQATIRRAEVQIESTLSMLGTIYSQLLTGQSTRHVADYNRLAAGVDEEVQRLQDHLDALREVRLGG